MPSLWSPTELFPVARKQFLSNSAFKKAVLAVLSLHSSVANTLLRNIKSGMPNVAFRFFYAIEVLFHKSKNIAHIAHKSGVYTLQMAVST